MALGEIWPKYGDQVASKTDWKRHLKIIIFEVGLEGGQNPAPRALKSKGRGQERGKGSSPGAYNITTTECWRLQNLISVR